MKKHIGIILMAALVVNLGLAQGLAAGPDYDTEKEKQFKVIAYYSGSLFNEPLERLQTDKLTHIIYAFLIPEEDGGIVPLDEPDELKQLISKAHNDGAKVLIALGGWSYQGSPWPRFSNRSRLPMKKRKLLTAALNGAWSTTAGPEVSKLMTDVCLDSFNFINVMAYDMNNAEHSPLWFADTSVNYWLNRGVPADKIILGMPLYARPSWKQYRHQS